MPPSNIVRHLTEDLITGSELGFRRVKMQSLTVGQQQVIDGTALETNWLEAGIPVTSSRYAEFTVPVGVYMILALRILNPSGDTFLYRVFPQGTYTAGTAKTDDGSNFAKTRNLRQGSAVTQNLIRINVTTPPVDTAQIIYEPVWGQVNAGNRSVGDLESDDSYLILNPNQKFLLEMRNNGTTNPMSAQVKLQYAFIPVDAVSPSLV